MRKKIAWFLFLAVVATTLLLGGFMRLRINPIGLQLAKGWQARSLTVWRREHPDMMALSPSGVWLYVSCETGGGLSAASLAAIRLETGHKQILISGLRRADGLKFAPDSSLWLGEEFSDGLIWRITDADRLPPGQEIDRSRMQISSATIAPFYAAGRFAHEGFAFSSDRRVAYLADESPTGGLYRLRLRDHRLAVLGEANRWRAIKDPMQAREAARLLQAKRFARIEDMETLPDGRILMAETGSGRILILRDRGEEAEIQPYLQDARLAHPDNLAWDERRRWLWITDDSKPSALWAWDGRKLSRIAVHAHAEITGVLSVGMDVYINLQGRTDGPELTVRLFQK